jgi:hypothetical protein
MLCSWAAAWRLPGVEGRPREGRRAAQPHMRKGLLMWRLKAARKAAATSPSYTRLSAGGGGGGGPKTSADDDKRLIQGVLGQGLELAAAAAVGPRRTSCRAGSPSKQLTGWC